VDLFVKKRENAHNCIGNMDEPICNSIKRIECSNIYKCHLVTADKLRKFMEE